MSEEDYKAAARELVGKRTAADAFAATGIDFVPTGGEAFNLGSDASAGGQLRNAYAMAVGMGSLDASQVSLAFVVGSAAQAQREKEQRERAERRDFEERLNQLLLNRIEFHEDQMRETGERLRAIYGDDIVGGLAAKYLTSEQLATARTEEERMEALADVLLDEHGEIRPEYAGTDDARYVYHWGRARELRGNLDELPNASPERAQEIYDDIREEGTETLFHTQELAQHRGADDVAETAVDQRAERDEVDRPANALVFGPS